ncbi:MAG: 16S rRNA (adenine(1518)-N(6)/adenine(1519)-N(6))-dimethyltransferase [Candidatus Marinimicrobia bacterium]|nr:16S rRNA (adenine(1518)-N(6)/adenine(1519)-N(6))-dimethyltransferase [Candidatus Neomarinimicrobiota bacterium]|tara:strand:+ start:5850 stop:6617 length:768 start_codon:yes stop_codon:yes gene_type:complete
MRHFARKRLGQHFLADKNLLGKLVDLIGASSSDSVLEIGPGGGVLTELLAPQVNDLVGVEIDRDLFQGLSNRTDLKNCTFINEDFLKLDWRKISFETEKVRVIGNLPYNISSMIVFKLIEGDPFWRDCHFMVQNEVAKRMTAPFGSKPYGRLSVNLQARADVQMILNVPPEVFVPKPKVESAVVRIIPLSGELLSTSESDALSMITRFAFGQRRKMLRNSLASLKIDDSLFDLSARPEKLQVSEFIELAKWVAAS